jgi:drug/metabolite transporter (DMT)-like permease
LPAEETESSLRLYLLILVMVILWSANYIIGKFALRELPPLLVVGLRMIVSGLTMIPIFAGWRRKTGTAGFERRDIPMLLALGLLGVGLNQLLFISGLARTSVAHAAIMIGLTPILVLLLAAAAGQEKLSAARLIGMGIALAGVAVLQFSPAGKQAGNLIGDLLVFGGALTFAIFTVQGKSAVGRVAGVAVNTFAYVGTGVALLPMTFYLGSGFEFQSISPLAWTSVLYMSLFPSVVAYLIYYYALARIPASRLSAFSYLQPLLATAMAIPALGEYPTRSLLAGGILVLAGVFVAERV